jgi:hypothetical protein
MATVSKDFSAIKDDEYYDVDELFFDTDEIRVQAEIEGTEDDNTYEVRGVYPRLRDLPKILFGTYRPQVSVHQRKRSVTPFLLGEPDTRRTGQTGSEAMPPAPLASLVGHEPYTAETLKPNKVLKDGEECEEYLVHEEPSRGLVVAKIDPPKDPLVENWDRHKPLEREAYLSPKRKNDTIFDVKENDDI